jgi:superoxide dismutase, Cu-Zn family
LCTAGSAAFAAVLLACGSGNGGAPAPESPSAPEHQGHTDVSRGTLAPPAQGQQNAFTYNPAAPAGALLTVSVQPGDSSTTVALDATGLQPNRGYAAHAHTNPCGPTGAAAGPHFQNRVDPAATPDKPSTDPAYANPTNEIWLDFRTDQSGAGRASTTVPFALTDRAPGSVVVHEAMATATAPGQAGNAGGRSACLTLTMR